MSKFVLLDHSLVSLGGHHFDYAEQLLRVASVKGFQVIVAANRQFRRPAPWDAAWETHPILPFQLYDEVAPHGIGATLDEEILPEPRAATAGPRNWLAPVGRRAELYHGRRQAAGMIRALRHFFSRIDLREGDHVFLPTASIFDFLCLAEFWKDQPTARMAHWHLQFHYGPTDADDAAKAAVHDQLARALAATRHMRRHFYATTAGLTEQYRDLGIVDCQTLSHHVSPEFAPDTSRVTRPPLRVLCAGCPRQEKGYEHLSKVLLDLWNDHFGTGQAQLCLQAKPSLWMPNRPRRKVASLFGDSAGSDPRFQIAGEAQGPLAYVRFPLPASDYVRMIRAADVGLFLYDVDAYRHRCSGVFVELLAAGIPVVVPGRCWMAEQVEAANARCCARFGAGRTGLGSARGRVGLVADSLADVPQLLREILDHYADYRAHAVAHAETWRGEHSADNTLQQLLQKANLPDASCVAGTPRTQVPSAA